MTQHAIALKAQKYFFINSILIIHPVVLGIKVEFSPYRNAK
jgi:hypothetical protein